MGVHLHTPHRHSITTRGVLDPLPRSEPGDPMHPRTGRDDPKGSIQNRTNLRLGAAATDRLALIGLSVVRLAACRELEGRSARGRSQSPFRQRYNPMGPDGHPKHCFKCNSTEHMIAECPRNNNRYESNVSPSTVLKSLKLFLPLQ